MQLYGRDFSYTECAEHCGSAEQFAGVKLYTLEDGAERGVRCLEFRTGSGFSFTVMIDRAMDIGDANYRGAALGWHSPTGFRNPNLHEYDSENGLGNLRSFSGLLMTCGLDHILSPCEDDASHYHYPHRETTSFPVHGRLAFTPAKLSGYGAEWQGNDYLLWCEGIITQASVFGEHLQLSRRIESVAGSKSFVIKDRIINQGFSSTPHMYMYHINVGYPVLAEGSRYVAPVSECIWAAHDIEAQGVGYKTQSGPRQAFVEQAYEHLLSADENGKVPVALINDQFNQGNGLGLVVEYDIAQFPCLYQWQCYQKGLYTMGIEPSTNHVLGKPYARAENQLQWLEHGQEQSYEVTFSVLEGRNEIATHEQRVANITEQLSEEFVQPTGNWHLNNKE